MKIKRTIKDEYLGIPLKYAGETEIIGEERMDEIIRSTRLGSVAFGEQIPSNEAKVDQSWRQFKANRKIETFYANYELIEA
jgi:hypothetical protein